MGSKGANMGALSEDFVAVRLGKKPGDPTLITINCPDQLGLACDFARTVLEFGLHVARGDFSTDGRWCFMLFWVSPILGSARPIQWALLKRRLVLECPSSTGPLLLPPISLPNRFYLLQACSGDRTGLLNDLTQRIWELDLEVLKFNVTTSPDGRVISLFYLSDPRSTLLNKSKREYVCDILRVVLGDSCFFCELHLAFPDASVLDSVPSSGLRPSVADDLTCERSSSKIDSMFNNLGELSVNIDNHLSPGHSLLQIAFRDRKGLLYDCMRTLKDLNIQVAYGRLCTTPKGIGDFDLFILQGDGSKLCDPQKQNALLERLKFDVRAPVRVILVNRGPDTELLVATPLEMSKRARPRLLYDVTLALRMLEISIFKADSTKLHHGDRQWEVYKFLLAEQPSATLTSSRTRSYIAERVKNVLMG